MTVGQSVPRAAGGWAVRRSARRVSMVPPVSPRREPACAALASPAAAARMLAQQAGLGLAAKRGAPAPMMDTATRPLAAAAAPRGGPVSAAREPVTVGTGDLTAATSATAAQAMGAAMPSVACARVRPATWARGASSGVPRATMGQAVGNSANVSTEQPVTMSAGPAPARPAGGEPSVSVPARPASSEWTATTPVTAVPGPPVTL